VRVLFVGKMDDVKGGFQPADMRVTQVHLPTQTLFHSNNSPLHFLPH